MVCYQTNNQNSRKQRAGVDKRLFFLINTAQRQLLSHAEQVSEQQLGLNITQMAALMLINSQPGCMQKDVVNGLGLKKSAVTSLLVRLEQAGLIQRQINDDDARVVNLIATEAGSKKARQAKPLIEQLNQRLTTGFNADELDVIARFLNQIRSEF